MSVGYSNEPIKLGQSYESRKPMCNQQNNKKRKNEFLQGLNYMFANITIRKIHNVLTHSGLLRSLRHYRFLSQHAQKCVSVAELLLLSYKAVSFIKYTYI